jgi:hypothetical protein
VFEPHLHAPPAHVSARSGSHGVHALPLLPHAVVDGVVHALPLQHPFGQFEEHPEQTPLLHVSPPPHGAHIAPAVPHAVGDGVVHTLPAQHPLGQLAALQTQLPPTHACPTAHTPFAPHMQLPATHESARVASHVPHELPAVPHAVTESGVHTPLLQHPFEHDVESHSHAPFTQRCPCAHIATPVAHSHAPFALHADARAGSHVMHDVPPTPHDVKPDVLHTSPSQHPFGHDAALHTH